MERVREKVFRLNVEAKVKVTLIVLRAYAAKPK